MTVDLTRLAKGLLRKTQCPSLKAKNYFSLNWIAVAAKNQTQLPIQTETP